MKYAYFTTAAVLAGIWLTPVHQCGTYTEHGIARLHCATCGDGICEAYERCTPSVIHDMMATADCGALYCPHDCRD